MLLVGVVSGQKGGAKGAMRGNRGKVSSWPDNFVDILMLSDIDVACRVTKNPKKNLNLLKLSFFSFSMYYYSQGGSSRGGRGRGGGSQGGVGCRRS